MNTKKTAVASGCGTEEALDRSILDYLKRHPHAEDTVEGIAQWWLLEQRIRTELKRIQTALVRLVARKKLATRRGPDGRVLYRLNP